MKEILNKVTWLASPLPLRSRRKQYILGALNVRLYHVFTTENMVCAVLLNFISISCSKHGHWIKYKKQHISRKHRTDYIAINKPP